MPRDDGAPTVEELTREVQWAVIHAGYMSDDARRPDVLTWLVSHLPAPIAAQGQGLRDDGAPPVDALRVALADAQTAFSGEDDRHAALGWLLSHLSSLIADSERLDLLDEHLEDVRWQWPGNRIELEWFVGDGDPEPNLRTTGATIREACDRAREAFNPVRATPHGSES